MTVNARDPYALGSFWAQALDSRLADDDAPGDPAATVLAGPYALLFEQAEGRQTHLDLQPDQPRAQEVARMQALGATVVEDRTRPDGAGWVVMADPEGNLFCVLRSGAERGEEPVDTGERPMPTIGTADERTMLLAMLDWYRDGVVAKVEGLRQDLAVHRLGRSQTTVAGLVKHLALVEDAWFTERIARQPMPEPWAGVDWDARPDWEFETACDEPLEENVQRYREACERSRAVCAAKDLDDTGVSGSGRTVSLRYVLLHLVEETARHLGHLDLLRELLDGTTGE